VADKSAVGAVTAGGSATWTITVRNDGPDPVTGSVTVTDVLPTELTFESAEEPWTCPGGSSPDAGPVVCEHPGPLAVGDAVELTLVTSVAADAGEVVNRASVSAGNVDPDPDSDVATATVMAATPAVPVPSRLPATGAGVVALLVVGLWMVTVGAGLRRVGLGRRGVGPPG